MIGVLRVVAGTGLLAVGIGVFPGSGKMRLLLRLM
jgi:hypothetical protein